VQESAAISWSDPSRGVDVDVTVVDDPEALGRRVASLVLDRLSAEPGLVLGVATGSSPRSTYRALAQARDEGTDFTQMRCVALDEYVDLPASDPRSYHAFIAREIIGALGVRPENVLVPDGNAADPEAACRDFEEAIHDLGGVGLQLLGIGRNGHVGFNEPGSDFTSRTHLSRLSPTTRADNARFFARPVDVPTYCLTQGIGTILDASTVVLIASGARKAEAVAAAVRGPVTETCPASVLQRHPDATVVVDRNAAARLLGSTTTNLPMERASIHGHRHLR
jgi:glucosamine-6-phosphate deaminase